MTGFISLLRGARGLYEWISGNTIGDRLKRMEKRLGAIDVLSKRIGLLEETEFRYTSGASQNLCEDTGLICKLFQPIQSALKKDVVVSTPIAAPKEVQGKLTCPELYLSNIQPVTPQLHAQSINDPSVVPITFRAGGRQLAGFLKRGHIGAFLGCEYSPHVTLEAIRESHPLQDTLVTPNILPDGRMSIDCVYCNCDGREPYPDGDLFEYYYTGRKCSVCQGRRVVFLIASDLLVDCPLCRGNGHEPTPDGWKYNVRCEECDGLGAIALTGSLEVINGDP